MKVGSSNPSKNFNVGKQLVIASEQEFQINKKRHYWSVDISRKKRIIVSLGEFSNLLVCGSG